MSFDPTSLDLDRLFRDPAMFDSRDAWRSAGFKVFDRTSPKKIMVGRHPDAPGYMFKKYSNDVADSMQMANFTKRIEGARQLRAFFDAHQLKHVVVPRKWIYTHPRAGARSPHVFVAERLDILDGDGTKDAYAHIHKRVLKELGAVLFRFQGLDSVAANLPFTRDGRVAFIDTEHWNRHQGRRKKCHICHYLSDEMRERLVKIFDKLEDKH